MYYVNVRQQKNLKTKKSGYETAPRVLDEKQTHTQRDSGVCLPESCNDIRWPDEPAARLFSYEGPVPGRGIARLRRVDIGPKE